MVKNRTAIYTRVSTGGQTASLATQLELCKRAAQMRGLEVVLEVSEVVSGGAANLPQRAALLKAARQGKFDVLVVTRLDRFGRSLIDLLAILKELRSIGVNFVSVEDGIDFSTSAGQLQANLLAVIAEFEKALIRERAEEGRQAAKVRGVKFGRKPIVSEQMAEEILAYLILGEPQAAVARMFGVHRSVVYRIKEKWKEESARNSPPETPENDTDFRALENPKNPENTLETQFTLVKSETVRET